MSYLWRLIKENPLGTACCLFIFGIYVVIYFVTMMPKAHS